MNYGQPPRRNDHQARVRDALTGFMRSVRPETLSPMERRPPSSRTPKPGSEKAIQLAILKALPRLCGILVARTENGISEAQLAALQQGAKGIAWRNNTGKVHAPGVPYRIRYGLPGQADISGILRGGRRLEIEVKRPGQRQSPSQVAFMEAIQAMGGLYMVATSVEDVVEKLLKIAMANE